MLFVYICTQFDAPCAHTGYVHGGNEENNETQLKRTGVGIRRTSTCDHGHLSFSTGQCAATLQRWRVEILLRRYGHITVSGKNFKDIYQRKLKVERSVPL